MSTFDARGCTVSGAEPAALATFERAMAAYQGWRSGADVSLALALQQAPGFVMAHVLQAWLLLCSRDPQSVRAAPPALERAARLPANERERMHLAAIAAAIADDFEGAKARLGEVLRLQPRDALALQVAHSFDYVTGDAVGMLARVAAVLPAWSSDLPGYHAVLAMHAFGLEECGEYERAEATAHAALDLNALDARAHHVIAHVFEMTERADAGARWMNAHSAGWSIDTVVATHCWWHVALFCLAQGQRGRALALYDRRIRAGHSSEIADLIDAAALLWRIQLSGAETGRGHAAMGSEAAAAERGVATPGSGVTPPGSSVTATGSDDTAAGSDDTAARWAELAEAWAPHIDDGYCSFNDLHAMLAFVGARDWDRAQRLELALAAGQSRPTRHGATTRQLGLPACRALIAFGRGNDPLAITLLASLPALAHRLGGSHAQRDVLHVTLLQAIEHVRRPARRQHVTPLPINAPS
jgi:tetratricopeptide (TPR) repeat protein